MRRKVQVGESKINERFDRVPQYSIRGSTEDGFFAHVWFGYKPSEQFDVSATEAEAVSEVLAEYPNAIRTN